tara:strand:+ start:693 stop:1286 length:594 start_codon:yes stop_codon:yes gene_type:complete
MTEHVYFTILNIHKYIPSDEFNWSKAIDLVSCKLSPYFAATMGSYCDNISNFRESYESDPIYVPIDNCPEISSGQLFMLRDIVNNTGPITNFPILTKDPVLKNYYSSFNIELQNGINYGGTDDSIVVPNCNLNTETYNDSNNYDNDYDSDEPPPLISASDSNYDTDSEEAPTLKSLNNIDYSLEVHDFRHELSFDDM